MVETRSGTITHPPATMPENPNAAPVTHMTSLPNVHAISPRHVVRMFDGTRPDELEAVIRECETAVKTRFSEFQTQSDFESPQFSNACLNEAVLRFDMKKNDVNTAYHLWKTSENPTWLSLCQEMRRCFISPYTSAPQAAHALLSLHPTGSDLQSLMNHVSHLIEPYEALSTHLKTDPDLADLFNFPKIHKLRNFLFLQSLLGCAPKEYHSAILEKLSIKDSPSDTCLKLAKAVTQIVGKKANHTAASVWSHDVTPQDIPQVIPPMTLAPVQSTRTYNQSRPTSQSRPPTATTPTPQTASPSWSRPTTAMSRKQPQANYREKTTTTHNHNKSWVPTKGLCTNCGKPDHTYRRCPYTQFCWFHMNEGHSWFVCPDYPDQVQAAKSALGFRW